MTGPTPYPNGHGQPDGHLPGHDPEMTPEDFQRVRSSPEFQRLRAAFRGFAFPMTVAFLAWYFAYVLASTFARDLMSTTIPGMDFLNVGLLAGLGQFVTTFLITWLYVRHANTTLDPIATSLRDDLEKGRR
ncbi:MAG: DUF485 domain-containing protein [Propionibacteriaceae bacterium]|nr:DUF485 domain-containing protein [Propionibacteriaceae bacterium]